MTTLVIGSAESTIARAQEYGHEIIDITQALALYPARMDRRSAPPLAHGDG